MTARLVQLVSSDAMPSCPISASLELNGTADGRNATCPRTFISEMMALCASPHAFAGSPSGRLKAAQRPA